MQTLTLDEVRRRCRAAHAAKLLTAQHPNPKARICVYSAGPVHGCAIGVCLTPESLAYVMANRLNTSTPVQRLYEGDHRYEDTDETDAFGYRVHRHIPIAPILDTPLPDRTAIEEIQCAHDHWANLASGMELSTTSSKPRTVAEAERAFLNLIREGL